ncbi:MAG: lamin tail domain-containing protein [Euryarchaeota archaeon]|nr:lamin tail domain-containing protein [Euryarchaeota archaeon]
MPRALLALVLVVLLGPQPALGESGDGAVATASTMEEKVIIPWTNGTFVAGLLGIGIREPVPFNMRTWNATAEGCERRLYLDLLYAPKNLTGQDRPLVELDFSMIVTVEKDGERADRILLRPATGIYLGELAEPGPFDLSIRQRVGFAVDWSLRLIGKTSLNGDGCGPEPLVNIRITELEQNPNGTDHGDEWVEIHNKGTATVDLGGWTVGTMHGLRVNVTLSDETFLDPGAFLIVRQDAQWLDNEEEQVVFWDPTGGERDRTPWLTDTANDERSWQLVRGEWTFTTATPGAPPA